MKKLSFLIFLVLAKFSVLAQLNRQDFSFSTTGDPKLALGRYEVGSAINILCQVEGGWAEAGGNYEIVSNYNQLPRIVYRGESNDINTRLKFSAYLDPANAGFMYLFVSWINWSPAKASNNIIKLSVSTMGQMYINEVGIFDHATELPAILTINSFTQRVGIGTVTPEATLDVKGEVKLLSGTAPLNITSVWSASPDAVTNTAEISNDISNYKNLMIAGNRAAGANRRVSIWDAVDVGGAGYTQTLNVNGGTYIKGYTGIGTMAPQGPLHVVNNTNTQSLLLEGNSPGWGSGLVLKNSASGGKTYGIYSSAYGTLNISDNITGQDRLFINSNGNVGIGTTDPKDFKLAVNGSAVFTKVVVRANNGNWPDYVFEPTYQLPSLQEVEAFIKEHKHLPEVPSAKEVEANGLDLGINQAVLLKKIEEQMLYILELNKKQDALLKKIEALERQLSKQK